MQKTMDKYQNITIGAGAQGLVENNNGGIVIGNFAIGGGQNSIAIGSANGSCPNPTQAIGNYSIAIGCGTVAKNINNLGEIKIGNPNFNINYYDGGSGWKIGSDIRDKIDITNINDSLKFVSQVNPIKFRYNYRRNYNDNYSLIGYDKEAHQQHKLAEKTFNYGVSAQEVGSILKTIYGTEYYGNIVDRTVEADPSGIEDYYTVNLVNFIPFLIGAIKEQQEQIEELKLQVEVLNEKQETN